MRQTLSCLIFVFAISTIDLNAEVRRATGSIELSDPAGDVKPINTSNGPQPGLDIIKVSITSDGKQISVAATLAKGSGALSNDFLELYFDTDRSAKTGVTLLNPEIGGFDLKGELDACAAYSDRSSGCTGGHKAPVTRRYAMLRLHRFKGKTETDGFNPVVTPYAFAPAVNALEVPFTGSVVQASLDYTALKVKPGQTIRILARETSSGASSIGEMQGFFPEILLTLK